MVFRQFFLEGLGCLSYMIGCSQMGLCAVVDPQRDVDGYLQVAQSYGLRITHIFDTHLHADHVSGNRELAARTGATIYLPAQAEAAFKHQPLHNGDEVNIGTVTLRAIHTPGHTPEHMCLAVIDHTRGPEPWFLLTGDFLFVGDIGRPDLLGEAEMRQLADQMYTSLFDRLSALDDGLEVFPGHGAGSLCGRNMNAKLSTTLGFERRFNPALQPRSRQEFIAWLTQDLPPQPANVPYIKQLNRQGPPILGELYRPKPLTAQAVRDLLRGQGPAPVILDVRSPAEFAAGYMPGALNVPVSNGQFATRAGWFIPPERPIVLIVGREAEADRATRALARVGYDRVIGYLVNGITAWRALGLPTASLALWTPERLRSEALTRQGEPLPGVTIVDVRDRSEWQQGHIPGAVHIPLAELAQRTDELNPFRPTAVICASGTRSSTAASLLTARGFKHVANVMGGMEGWEAAGYPVVIDADDQKGVSSVAPHLPSSWQTDV